MKKILTIVLAIVAITVFASCSRTDYLNAVTHRDEKAFKETMDAVFETLDNDDEEGLKSLFAVAVIEENPELKNQIAAFFEIFSGPVEIEEWKLSASGSEKNEYGKRRTILHNSYDIIISAGGVRYHISMEMYSRDDFNKDNEGIHFLEISTDESYNSKDFVWHTRENSDPGFYYQHSTERRDDLRWVDGRYWRYTFFDRTLTAADLRAAAEKDDDFPRFVSVIGEPNCSWDTYEYYFYELENGFWAVVKLDYDVRPRDYYSNGELVELNLFRQYSIVAIYIADEETNLETVWMADDIVRIGNQYYYYSPIDRDLTEDYFKSFAIRSNSINLLKEEIGQPDIDKPMQWQCFYKLSDGRYMHCYYRNNGEIRRLSVYDTDGKLYTIWEEDTSND